MTPEQRDAAIQRGADPVALTLHLVAAALQQPEFADPPSRWGLLDRLVRELADTEEASTAAWRAISDEHYATSDQWFVHWLDAARTHEVVALVNRAHTRAALGAAS